MKIQNKGPPHVLDFHFWSDFGLVQILATFWKSSIFTIFSIFFDFRPQNF